MGTHLGCSWTCPSSGRGGQRPRRLDLGRPQDAPAYTCAHVASLDSSRPADPAQLRALLDVLDCALADAASQRSAALAMAATTRPATLRPAECATCYKPILRPDRHAECASATLDQITSCACFVEC